MAETILLDLKIDNEQATKGILEAKNALASLKKEQKELDKAYQEGSITMDEYTKASKGVMEATEVNTNKLKANTDALKQNVREETSKKDSLTQMRAELKKATTAYDNMSKAERDSAKGTELLGKIKDLTKNINELEQGSGRFQRNVGNYPKLLEGTPFAKASNLMNNLSAGTGKASDAFVGATGSVKGLSKQLLKLLANPIVAIIAAIVTVVMKLVQAFKKNDDAMTALQSAFAAFKPIVDLAKQALEAILGVVTKVIESFSKFVQSIMQAIPSMREFSKAEEDLVRSTDLLQDAEREYTVGHAKREGQIAELTAKANESENYSFEQRKGFLQQAMKLEEEDLKAKKAIAREKLRLATIQAKLDHDTSDETKNKIAELKAAVYAADAAYSQGTKRIRTKINEFEKQEKTNRDNAAKSRAEAYKKRQEDAKKALDAELAIAQQTEDLKLAAMAEGEDKSLAMLEAQHKRAMDAIRKRLEEDKTLTVNARASLNEQLILMEAQYQLDRAAVSQEWTDKRVAQEEKEAAERLKAQKDAEQAAKDELKRSWENYIAEAQAGSEERMRREITVRKRELDNLLQMEGETYEQFRARQLAAQEAYNQAVQALNDQQVANEEAKMQSLTDVMGGLQSIMDAFGEDNKAAAAASKALALAQIAISTGEAIAKGISAAMGTPFPGNLAAIATTAATVMSNMATAITTVKSAKFATGGYVEGAGTATSDSIPARLSNGESVLTAKATAAHYDELSRWNVEGGGIAFPNSKGRTRFAQGGVMSIESSGATASMLAQQQMLERAVRNIHPEVSVREITRMSNKVSVKERISKS